MTFPTHFVFKLKDHYLCPESVTDTISESIREVRFIAKGFRKGSLVQQVHFGKREKETQPSQVHLLF